MKGFDGLTKKGEKGPGRRGKNVTTYRARENAETWGSSRSRIEWERNAGERETVGRNKVEPKNNQKSRTRGGGLRPVLSPEGGRVGEDE